MKGLIKHTDIHLRIRTQIAEAGRESRAATETIKDEKSGDSTAKSFSREVLGAPPPWGWPEVTNVHVKTIICHVALFDN